MKKYTKQEVLNQRISFKPMTENQYNKLRKHFGIEQSRFTKCSYYRFYKDLDYINSYHGNSSSSYLELHNAVKSTKEISFEEFDFEDEFILPEKWCIKQNLSQEVCDWHRKQFCSTAYKDGTWIYLLNRTNCCYSNSIPNGFIEITLDQFKKYVLKQEIKNMSKRIIKSSQAQDIINIACSNWKQVLANNWAKSIVLNEDIEVSDSFYKEMRKACTTDQHKLFDEIFGKYEPGFTSDMLKIGEAMIVSSSGMFNNHVIIRTYSGFVNCNNVNQTWKDDPGLSGKKLEKGSEITIFAK